MILEASEFIKIIKELRSEKSCSDNAQDDINKINEKIIEEYDKTLKNSLNSQKKLNNKIEKLEADKHKLIEENKRLEESNNLNYKILKDCELSLEDVMNKNKELEDKNEAKINSIRENYERIIKEKTMTNIEDEDKLYKQLSDEKVIVSDLKKIIEKLENEVKSYRDKCEGLENTNKRTNKQKEMLEDKITRISYKVLQFEEKLTGAEYDDILLEFNKEVK